VARRPKEEIARRVAEMLAIIKLPQLGERYPYQLSGGQQQRVALARAIAIKPQVLLLDEPLSALDAKIRVSLRAEIRALQQELGITTVYVTHDQEEALSMSDLVCVMNNGRIAQINRPQQVYDRPADLFVADFVGKTTKLDVVIEDDRTARLADGRAIIVDGTGVRGRAVIALRPEAFQFGATEGSGNRLEGVVTHRIFLGSSAEYAVHVDGIGDVLVTTGHEAARRSELVEPGTTVSLGFEPGSALVFPSNPSP
jgi:spermidine/putrescine transport system ATP-binding protein